MAEHRIARQTVEIVAHDAGVAQRLADRAAANAPALAAVLARRFDAADDGRRRRIDRLVLTLPPCDPDAFDAGLAGALDTALARALPEPLSRADVADPCDDALDLLAAFVGSGVLPWWADARPDRVADAADALTRSDDPAVVDGLRVLLRAADAPTRLARALPDRRLAGLAARLTGLAADDLTALVLARVAASRIDPVTAAQRAWADVLAAAAAGLPGATLADLAGHVPGGRASATSPPRTAEDSSSPPRPTMNVDDRPSANDQADRSRRADAAALHRRERQPAAADRETHADETLPPRPALSQDGERAGGGVPDRSQKVPDTSNAPEPALSHQASGAAERHDGGSAGSGSREAHGPASPMPGMTAGPNAHEQTGERTTPSPATRRMPPPIAPQHDAIPVETAGLVLLQPFLPDYLTQAGLVGPDRRFVSPAAQHRAAALLDHLATAERNAPEWRLALPKLLAGLPIDALHEPGPPLDDAEAAGAEAMLAAALTRLPMLGHLTVGGLRGAWLARPGLLSVEHGGWRLRVERRAWDLLLDRLPWPVAAVRLPWMPDAVSVEW